MIIKERDCDGKENRLFKKGIAMGKILIKGGKLVFSEGVVEADLAIEQGLFTSIGHNLKVGPSDLVIDASENMSYLD